MELFQHISCTTFKLSISDVVVLMMLDLIVILVGVYTTSDETIRIVVVVVLKCISPPLNE